MDTNRTDDRPTDWLSGPAPTHSRESPLCAPCPGGRVHYAPGVPVGESIQSEQRRALPTACLSIGVDVTGGDADAPGTWGPVRTFVISDCGGIYGGRRLSGAPRPSTVYIEWPGHAPWPEWKPESLKRHIWVLGRCDSMLISYHNISYLLEPPLSQVPNAIPTLGPANLSGPINVYCWTVWKPSCVGKEPGRPVRRPVPLTGAGWPARSILAVGTRYSPLTNRRPPPVAAAAAAPAPAPLNWRHSTAVSTHRTRAGPASNG